MAQKVTHFTDFFSGFFIYLKNFDNFLMKESVDLYSFKTQTTGITFLEHNQWLNQKDLQHSPNLVGNYGQGWYSNWSFVLLAKVVEKTTGMSFFSNNLIFVGQNRNLHFDEVSETIERQHSLTSLCHSSKW